MTNAVGNGWCRQDVQATAQEVEEVEEFDAIEKLGQLGVNRGALLTVVAVLSLHDAFPSHACADCCGRTCLLARQPAY